MDQRSEKESLKSPADNHRLTLQSSSCYASFSILDITILLYQVVNSVYPQQAAAALNEECFNVANVNYTTGTKCKVSHDVEKSRFDFHSAGIYLHQAAYLLSL